MPNLPNILPLITWRRVWEEGGLQLHDLVERHRDVMKAVAIARKRGMRPPEMWLMELGVGVFGLVGDHAEDNVR